VARQTKNTVDYFPHYVKHRKTMFVFESRWGNDGYAFFFKLLEMLGEKDSHFLDLSDPGELQYFAAKVRLAESVVLEMTELLVTMGKIDRELWERKRIIWYQGYVDKLCDVYKKRNRPLPARPVVEEAKEPQKIISGPETPISGPEIPANRGVPAQKCDKVNESKDKDLKQTSAASAAVSPAGGSKSQNAPEKTTPKSVPIFTPEGRQIAGSMWGKLVQMAGGDTYKAARALFKARNANDIAAYLNAGYKDKTLWLCSTEMEYNSRVVDEWIGKTFGRNNFSGLDPPQPKRGEKVEPQALGDILSILKAPQAR
jgi:hypothetical protein